MTLTRRRLVHNSNRALMIAHTPATHHNDIAHSLILLASGGKGGVEIVVYQLREYR